MVDVGLRAGPAHRHPGRVLAGLLSYAAYNPGLGGANDLTPDKGILGFYLFDWPTEPLWLYRLTQGVHVTLGLVLVPVVLGKLWSVIPKLFDWPPFRSVAQLVERLSLVLLVGGIVFEMVTGILNIQLFYEALPFSFYTAHFYGAWVFMAAFVVHSGIRFGRDGWLAEVAQPGRRAPDADGVHGTRASRRGRPGLADPAPATMSRRGALGLVGAGSLSLFVLSVGDTLGGPSEGLPSCPHEGRRTGRERTLSHQQDGGRTRHSARRDRSIVAAATRQRAVHPRAQPRRVDGHGAAHL